ncbi:MAG: glycosyltransferase family 39 protein [Anaerolineales bacterium]|nr:glycosyltransferase family 39 protein [Anaerolineales bacterium]
MENMTEHTKQPFDEEQLPDQEEKTFSGPSVWDYFIAKLTPWRGPVPEIPTIDSIQYVVPEKALATNLSQTTNEERTENELYTGASSSAPSWLQLVKLAAPVLLALLGQSSLGQGESGVAMGITLYVLAVAALLYAILTKTWQIPGIPLEPHLPENQSYRPIPLGIGLISGLLAFILFKQGENQFYFTPLNMILWLGSLGLVLYAFWLPSSRKPVSVIERFRKLLNTSEWEIKFNKWHFLAILVSSVIVFFRFYRLADVPAEMVSDHAEKLLDVFDILNGKPSIFFPRNTGREPLQFYMIALVAKFFGTGISFISMKIGTALMGVLMLIYVYLLGKELGNRWIGLLAVVLMGVAVWPNILARVALRFILYPAFAVPTLYYLVQGLKTRSRNAFLLAGLFLGIGLNGYTPFRIVPFLVVLGFLLYTLHEKDKAARQQALTGLFLIVIVSMVLFLPLGRYWLAHPNEFAFRAFSRLGSVEAPLPGPAVQVFLQNLWNGLKMINYDNGSIWVVGLTHVPVLDVISASFFIIGFILQIIRYILYRRWEDLLMLLAIPMLMMPSILSLAFPGENPAPNRAGGAVIPVIYTCAVGLYSLLKSVKINGKHLGTALAAGIGVFLLGLVMLLNFQTTFEKYDEMYLANSWNTSEMGAVIAQFSQTTGDRNSARVVAYPHWTDNRLVGINAGYPDMDYSLWPEDIPNLQHSGSPMLFLVNTMDNEAIHVLEETYPTGTLSLHESERSMKNFYVYYVPAEK